MRIADADWSCCCAWESVHCQLVVYGVAIASRSRANTGKAESRIGLRAVNCKQQWQWMALLLQLNLASSHLVVTCHPSVTKHWARRSSPNLRKERGGIITPRGIIPLRLPLCVQHLPAMQRLYGTVSLWCFGPSLEAKRQNSDLHGEWSVRVPCVSSCLAPFLSCLSRRLMDGGQWRRKWSRGPGIAAG